MRGGGGRELKREEAKREGGARNANTMSRREARQKRGKGPDSRGRPGHARDMGREWDRARATSDERVSNMPQRGALIAGARGTEDGASDSTPYAGSILRKANLGRICSQNLGFSPLAGGCIP